MVITSFLFTMLTSNSLNVRNGMAFGSVMTYLPVYFCHVGRASSYALAWLRSRHFATTGVSFLRRSYPSGKASTSPAFVKTAIPSFRGEFRYTIVVKPYVPPGL